MRSALSTDRLRSVYDKLAQRYDFQHRAFTLGADERGRRFIAEQAVRPKDHVLDAGSGTGSTAILAAMRAGPTGHVTLFDFSDAMLNVARKRMAAMSLSDRVDFRTGDMLSLPFADASFDVVLSTYSICPLFAPEAGARELYRVLKPGGRLGIAHSASPQARVMYWLAERLEDAIWHIPAISMGCRAVSVLPALQQAGAHLLIERRLGVPLYPFVAFVVEKPG